MKRYEGLFILNTSGKEDGVKELIDKISAEITALGGQIETVQKMDKRNFARVADKRHTAGFYVNIIFRAAPAVAVQLQSRFALSEEVLRTIFTIAPPPKTTAETAAA